MQILLDIRQNENGLNYLFDILKKNGVQAPFDCGCGVGVAIDRYIEEDFNMIWGSDFQSELITGLQQKFKNKQKVNFFCWDIEKILSNSHNLYFDAISLYSVLPYVEDWRPLFSSIQSISNGTIYFAVSFPNILFDFYSANKFTGDLFRDHLISPKISDDKENLALQKISNFFDFKPAHRPGGAYEDFYYFQRENPLTIDQKLKKFGCQIEEIRYLNYHPVPPRFEGLLRETELKLIKEAKECDITETVWSDMFNHSTFLVLGFIN